MKKGVFIFWFIIIGITVFRLVFSYASNISITNDCMKEKVTGMGMITEEPERKETGQILIIKVDELLTNEADKCSSDILIRAKTKLYPRFSFGDHIKFIGNLSEPYNFSSNDGRTFDYRNYLAKDDIYFEIKSAIVEKINEEKSFSIKGSLYKIKRRFVSNIEQVLGEPHSAFAAGLVVGEKGSIGKSLLDDFRITGLIHIVVLSGFNITIIADAIRKLLSRLPRMWGILLGGLGIILFGIMVGGGATVIRSCVMASIALSAELVRRDYSVVRALVFAGMIMLIQNPMILFHDPSFQLSFLATLGLVILARPIEDRLTFLPEKFGFRSIISATFATQIFVSPFILYMMGQLSIIGVVVNVLVLPFIPITMLAVFLVGISGFIFEPISQFFSYFAYALLSYELNMVEYFAKIPFASFKIPAFSFWWVVGFYLGFSIIFYYFYRRNRVRAENNMLITSTH
jgi:competence protein ComEC